MYDARRYSESCPRHTTFTHPVSLHVKSKSESETYVMVPAKQHQERTRRWRHEKQPLVSPHILPQPPCPIHPPHPILARHSLLCAPVKNTQVQIAARIVDIPILIVGIEDTVNNQIRIREKQAVNPARVGRESILLVSRQECVKNEPRVWEAGWRNGVEGRHRARVGRTSFAKRGNCGIAV